MPSLFGSSGVRGVYGRDITPSLIIKLGYAISAFIGRRKTISIGIDTRASSPLIKGLLASSFMSSGHDVVDYGVLPTPALSFLTGKHTDFGAMITASHNPPEYNGVKVFDHEGKALGPCESANIEKLFDKAPKMVSWNEVGSLHDDRERLEEYLEYVISLASPKLDKLKIVFECFNATACMVVPHLRTSTFKKSILLNSSPSPIFSVDRPEPSPETTELLQKVVKAEKAFAGIAYDGDCDRFSLVDEKGRFIELDKLLAFYARHLVENHDVKVIVTNISASMVIDELVESAGGKVVRVPVGDVYVADEMKKQGTTFGGEPCGAWIHFEHNKSPDGIISSILMLNILSEEGKPSKLFDEIPSYHIIRYNLECPPKLKVKVVENFKENIERILGEPIELLEVDGVFAKYNDYWCLVRSSGTEDVVRVTVEARERAMGENVAKKIVSHLRGIIR
ncbi:hypothetical protein DRO21_01020 [archaeon]|nr:MAG: hypothetical protein DRO21_01020 [archaeon]